jgi:hypothetical protein
MIQSWGKRPFQATMYACVQFVALTFAGMFVYPGGTNTDPTTVGYSFTENFFSSLGRTVASNGSANTVAAILFFTALATAGLGLVWFFVAILQFFRQTRTLGALSILGSIFGVITGLAYVGVAFTPADLFLDIHRQFVLIAFQAFLVVSIFYTLAILLNRRYPNTYAAVYLVFAVLLALYVWLMFNGPKPDTPEGLVIQATGQKMIVYAAIICMFVQGYGAVRLHAPPLEEQTTCD